MNFHWIVRMMNDTKNGSSISSSSEDFHRPP
jgi:hypothetical protein